MYLLGTNNLYMYADGVTVLLVGQSLHYTRPHPPLANVYRDRPMHQTGNWSATVYIYKAGVDHTFDSKHM